MKNAYVGIDVQVSRPCVFTVIDEKGAMISSGWHTTAADIFKPLKLLAEKHRLYIGIDASRMPLPAPRQWYWNGAKQVWRKKTPKEKGLGRHCEIVVKALNLANPQWTPGRQEAPDWMKLGFELFRRLDKIGTTYEAFPSASYTQLQDDSSVQLTVNFSNVMKRGAGDLFDALMAAATVREFVNGRGCEIGGGDRLGTIILPRPLENDTLGVLSYPA